MKTLAATIGFATLILGSVALSYLLFSASVKHVMRERMEKLDLDLYLLQQKQNELDFIQDLMDCQMDRMEGKEVLCP